MYISKEALRPFSHSPLDIISYSHLRLLGQIIYTSRWEGFPICNAIILHGLHAIILHACHVICFTNQDPALQIAVSKGQYVNGKFYKGAVQREN